MNLFLDQGLPVDAVELLRAAGHSCVHVSEIGMQRAPDEEILLRAVADAAVVVTLDADFHSLVAVKALRKPSVIRLRKEGCQAEEVASLVREVIEGYGLLLESGCLISIKNRKTTIHRLPIGA